MTPPLHLIDISNNNGKAMENRGVPIQRILEWAKEAGCWATCLKISQGNNSGDGGDSDFAQRFVRTWREEAHALGFEAIGLFHWVKPVDPASQLENAKRRCGELRDREFWQLDNEDVSPLGFHTITDAVAQGVIDHWENEWPDRNTWYEGWYYQANQVRRLHIPPESWWWPAYTWDMTYEQKKAQNHVTMDALIWQWGGGTEGAVFPQLGARVDSNQVINRDGLLRKAANTPVAQPWPQPQPPTHPTFVPTPEDPMWTIVHINGHDAMFIGMADHNGHIPVMTYLDDGAVAQAYLNRHAPEAFLNEADLGNCFADRAPADVAEFFHQVG
jgi:hypothetical protein